MTTGGDCSWKPQPSCSPAARSTSSRPASARNVATTPAANATPCSRCTRALAWPLGQMQRLQRQHREHARHQVEDQAADEGQQDRGEQRDVGARQGSDRRRCVDRQRRRRPLGAGADRSDQRHVDRHRRDGFAVFDEALGRPQHAGNPREFGCHLDRDRHRQRICAIAVARENLLGRRLDATFVVREELQRTRIRRARGRCQRERNLGPATLRGDLPSLQRRRQRGARGRDGAAPLRIRIGVFRHRQLNVEVRPFRDADILAYQPVGARGELERGTDQRIARNREAGQQQHLAFVAVVDERTGRQRARRRPLDRANANALRQFPGQCRRQAGVARIAPVRVPAIGHLEAQGERDRLARNHRRPFRHQFRLHVLCLHRARCGRGGQAERTCRQQRGGRETSENR